MFRTRNPLPRRVAPYGRRLGHINFDGYGWRAVMTHLCEKTDSRFF